MQEALPVWYYVIDYLLLKKINTRDSSTHRVALSVQVTLVVQHSSGHEICTSAHFCLHLRMYVMFVRYLLHDFSPEYIQKEYSIIKCTLILHLYVAGVLLRLGGES